MVVLSLGCRCCLPSVNTICGRIMIGLSLSSSVNTICGRVMIGLSLSSVSKHNMWSYYDWVVVVVFRRYSVLDISVLEISVLDISVLEISVLNNKNNLIEFKNFFNFFFYM